MPSYRVLVGLDYPPDRRAEPGDVVDDLPGKSIKWLTDQGLIEPADRASKPAAVKPAEKAAPKPAPVEGDDD